MTRTADQQKDIRDSPLFRIHDLRYTAASLMIQAGYPPKMVQEIMGHASITTTLDLYRHLYPDDTWTATRTDWTVLRLSRIRPESGQMMISVSRAMRR
jgi:integrase